MPNTNTKLVDSKTIAALFELTPRRIQQLTKEGIITATKEGNANRYDLLPTIQKYIRYLTAKANGREPSKKDAEIEGRRLEADVWRLRLTSSAARQTSPRSSSRSSRAPCTAARMSRPS